MPRLAESVTSRDGCSTDLLLLSPVCSLAAVSLTVGSEAPASSGVGLADWSSSFEGDSPVSWFARRYGSKFGIGPASAMKVVGAAATSAAPFSTVVVWLGR